MLFTKSETVSVVPLLTPSVGLGDDVVAGVELQAANPTTTATAKIETKRSLILPSPIELPPRHPTPMRCAATSGSIIRSGTAGTAP